MDKKIEVAVDSHPRGGKTIIKKYFLIYFLYNKVNIY